MANKEWLNEKKELGENDIEFYHNRINELERELEIIKSLIDLVEGQPTNDGTAR